ncbi:WD40 repeat-containing protein [Leptolyngbya sp. PCC 7375]|nr:WD40 repeat-containing protein [Leptolyngbya sp. PCC 7375]
MRDNKKVVQNTTPNHGNLEVLQDGATIVETSPIDRFLKQKDYLQTPYKGLNPYDEDDASIFFGRESNIQEVVNNLLAWRLTILYGKSGVGKSSILRAGVTHILNEEAQQNRVDYDGLPKLAVVVFPSLKGELSWKDDPLVSLMQQIETTIAQHNWDIPHPEPGLSFIDTLRHWTDALGGDDYDGELYIILDQFEEYFLYHENEQSEGTFYTEFPRAVNCPDLRVNFLISTREDSLASLDRFQSLIPDLFDHRLQIGHLSGRAAADAIKKPIDYYNQRHSTTISIEQPLVSAILDEVQVGKVVLGEHGLGGLKAKKERSEMQIEAPYLQLVMEQLWQKERDEKSDVLRLGTFKALGKADQIVKDHLSRQMKQLKGKRKRVAVGIFQHLVTASGIKYAYSIIDLADDTAYNQTLVKKVLETLSKGDQRILRPVGPAKPDQPNTQRYEIFHDALAPAILDWRREYLERGRIIWRAGISILGMSLGLGLIALASASYRENVDLLTTEAAQPFQQFEAGQQLDALQQAIKTGQQVQTWVQNNPFNWLLGRNKDQAINQATATIQNILFRIQEQNQFSISSGHVEKLKIDSAWEMAVTASSNGTVQVWELETGNQLNSFKVSESLHELSFTPDGQTLVIGTTEDTVQQWDWRTGEQLGTPIFLTNQLLSFNLSPDGQILATLSRGEEGTILQVWDWQTGNELAKFEPTSLVRDLDFSCDGTTLATAAEDGTVQVWDWRTGNEPAKFKPTSLLRNLDFSCDGATLATAAEDGTVRVWDWRTGNELTTFKPIGRVLDLRFSPDGQQLATALDTGNLRLRTLETDQFKQLSEVLQLTFSPDGQMLGTISSQGNIAHLWDTNGNLQVTLDNVDNLIFSPNGQQFATVLRENKTAHLRDTNGNLQVTLSNVDNLVFSPDGQMLGTISSQDNIAHLWDTNGNLQVTLSNVDNLVFSPDGQMLGTISSQDNTAHLWDTNGNLQATLSNVDNLVFSPDGQMLGTISWQDKTAHLWDTSDNSQIALESESYQDFINLTFSPDGRRLGTILSDNTARLWDTNGNLQITLDNVDRLIFSPDGQMLGTISSQDNTARLWDTRGTLLTTLPGITDIVFSPDGQQIAAISASGVVRILPVELEDLINLGCQWLQPYLESHPDELQDLPCSSIIAQQ